MANEIDAHVGMRLRQRRWMLGLTQQQLGDRVGIKFQQIQKYETGQNRISASRLWALAQVCQVPVGYYFEGLGLEAEGEAVEGQAAAERPSATQGDPLADREAAELLRAYYAATPARRRAAFELMRVLADGPTGPAHAVDIARPDLEPSVPAAAIDARPAARKTALGETRTVRVAQSR